MKRRLVLAAVVLLSLMASSQEIGKNCTNNNKVMVRWDIAVYTVAGMSPDGATPVHYFPPDCTSIPGECHSYPPEIVLTGSGTFQYGKNGRGENLHHITGGGTWTAVATDNTTTSGTYVVREVISFVAAPAFGGGVVPPDNIGDAADASSGTAILSIKYSDGSQGILILEGPDSMALGYVSVSKDISFYPAPHGFGCTDGYCLPEGTVFPIFHITSSQGP
jgi:hypothetical protein